MKTLLTAQKENDGVAILRELKNKQTNLFSKHAFLLLKNSQKVLSLSLSHEFSLHDIHE